ncbi:YicC/YloC family endoribonuclease [Thalassorhabdomicrobium marinisediminis]|uniref:YicC/YloC family endoribonuclease n=1 Tax=Thalassorhabdomicrobium marinisediminis TaxID=2170577 RepID=UPI002492539B|nr:YicC/YloC family endoribonuclease [Thalassorhabdomicrobium marinisediminis]
MIRSMTAFATAQGAAERATWVWELRSVNGRGRDVKLRLPEGIDGLEARVREAVNAQITRGNVSIGLRLTRDAGEGALAVDPARLDAVLDALDAVQERAFDKGVTLGQPTAADVLAQRGVLIATQTESADLAEPLFADFQTALTALLTMREGEGQHLHEVLTQQVDEIETLTGRAADMARARPDAVKAQMTAALARVMEDATGVDPDRVAQELALIAVKSDITEEIDRLRAHVQAARDLLAHGGPCGRKLDFLTQEFNREANTLCSKAQDVDLTGVGLALKAVIDQMREQVQNVE